MPVWRGFEAVADVNCLPDLWADKEAIVVLEKLVEAATLLIFNQHALTGLAKDGPQSHD